MMKESAITTNELSYVLPAGILKLNTASRLAFSPLVGSGKTPIDLSPLDTVLLAEMMRNPIAVVGESQMIVSHKFSVGLPNSFQAEVHRLREKLGERTDHKKREKFSMIHTIEGRGVSLISNEEIYSAYQERKLWQLAGGAFPVIFRHSAKFGDLVYIEDRNMAISPLIAGRHVELSFGEALLLKFLLQNPDQILTYEELLRSVGIGSNGDAQKDKSLIIVKIHRLRKKLGDNVKDGKLIFTHKNLGFSLTPQEGNQALLPRPVQVFPRL